VWRPDLADGVPHRIIFVRDLMSIRKTYEKASRQEINLTKSEVFFSRNLSIAAQEDLSKIMGVRKDLELVTT
jgi:hypothetical protein